MPGVVNVGVSVEVEDTSHIQIVVVVVVILDRTLTIPDVCKSNIRLQLDQLRHSRFDIDP